MKNRFAVLLLLLCVTACQPCIPPHKAEAALEPLPVNYAQINHHAYLKGKIAVGVVNAEQAQNLPFSAQDVKTALAKALKQAGFAARSYKGATYTVSARIVSVDTIPVCSLSTCTSKATIEYRVTDKKNRLVYKDVITSPHHYPGVVVSTDCLSKEGAIRNSFFELFLDLDKLTKSDIVPARGAK
jgi:hypothetical protein